LGSRLTLLIFRRIYFQDCSLFADFCTIGSPASLWITEPLWLFAQVFIAATLAIAEKAHENYLSPVTHLVDPMYCTSGKGDTGK